MKIHLSIIIIILSLILSSCSSFNKDNKSIPAKSRMVELRKENGKFQLFVDGQTFFIKGGGLEFGKMKSLADHGGNSFRTWRVDNGKVSGKEILDEAYRNGLMVCMGIEVGRERHGFNYDDEETVKKQFEEIKKDILKLKDHPALLMWGIGNELNLRHTNSKVWDAVNDIAAMIHKLDPNHPTTTMLAGAEKQDIQNIITQCPEIDLISFQLYGEIINLPQFIKESNYQGAYIVSEWGATGHWEVEKTNWDEPIEQNSSIKAKEYFKRYLDVIASDTKQCIGSFVFLWGQKQERTPTWYGIFLENGDKTEAVDVMEFLWTNKWPENRSPKIVSVKINNLTAYDNIELENGAYYSAVSNMSDPENDQLVYSWNIMKEVSEDKKSDGGDYEPKPDIIWELKADSENKEIKFMAPEKGIYRLFVYASDGKGSTATANIPFLVN